MQFSWTQFEMVMKLNWISWEGLSSFLVLHHIDKLCLVCIDKELCPVVNSRKSIILLNICENTSWKIDSSLLRWLALHSVDIQKWCTKYWNWTHLNETHKSVSFESIGSLEIRTEYSWFSALMMFFEMLSVLYLVSLHSFLLWSLIMMISAFYFGATWCGNVPDVLIHFKIQNHAMICCFLWCTHHNSSSNHDFT